MLIVSYSAPSSASSKKTKAQPKPSALRPEWREVVGQSLNQTTIRRQSALSTPTPDSRNGKRRPSLPVDEPLLGRKCNRNQNNSSSDESQDGGVFDDVEVNPDSRYKASAKTKQVRENAQYYDCLLTSACLCGCQDDEGCEIQADYVKRSQLNPNSSDDDAMDVDQVKPKKRTPRIARCKEDSLAFNTLPEWTVPQFKEVLVPTLLELAGRSADPWDFGAAQDELGNLIQELVKANANAPIRYVVTTFELASESLFVGLCLVNSLDWVMGVLHYTAYKPLSWQLQPGSLLDY